MIHGGHDHGKCLMLLRISIDDGFLIHEKLKKESFISLMQIKNEIELNQ
jgi:hypothetical protein